MFVSVIGDDSDPQITVGVGFMCPFGCVIRHAARLSTFQVARQAESLRGRSGCKFAAGGSRSLRQQRVQLGRGKALLALDVMLSQQLFADAHRR